MNVYEGHPRALPGEVYIDRQSKTGFELSGAPYLRRQDDVGVPASMGTNGAVYYAVFALVKELQRSDIKFTILPYESTKRYVRRPKNSNTVAPSV